MRVLWHRDEVVFSMHKLGTGILFALTIVACSKEAPQRTSDATGAPSAASSVAATSLSVTPPGWTLLQEFPRNTQLFAVGSAVIACEQGCEFTRSRDGQTPKLFWIDRTGKQEKASLWPDAAYKRLANLDVAATLRATETTGARVTFRGEAPEFLVSTNEVWGHDAAISIPDLIRSGDEWRLWKKSGDSKRSATKTAWNSGLFRPAPPHRFDEILLGSDVDCGAVWGSLFWGGTGPLLRADEHGLSRWETDHWKTLSTELPQRQGYWNGVRLRSGATLLAGSQSSWLVTPEGTITEIPVPVKGGELHLLDNRPVLFVISDKVQLWVATGAADVEAVWEEREPAPTVFSEALRLAAEADRRSSPLPKAAAWTDACKTPYVLLSRSRLTEQPWHEDLLKLLVGHPELQNKVRFLDSWDDQLEFGAQAQTEADARALMAILTAKVKGYRPQLLCRDLASTLPRLGETANVREVPVNLTMGCQGRP